MLKSKAKVAADKTGQAAQCHESDGPSSPELQLPLADRTEEPPIFRRIEETQQELLHKQGLMETKLDQLIELLKLWSE